MKIESINKSAVEKANKTELHRTRLRCIQVFDRHFKNGNVEKLTSGLSRSDLLRKYNTLIEVMRKQNLSLPTKDIDRALFSYNMRKRQGVEKSVSIISKAEEERIVFGVVYEPDVVDSQGDFASAEEIRKAAYSFAENGKFRIKLNHKGKSVNAAVLESYIAPNDLTIEGVSVSKGTWLMATRIYDEQIWKLIKEGSLTGYSMAGIAEVVPE